MTWRNERPFTVFTEKSAPTTVHVIYEKMKEISAGKSNEFRYGQTTLYHLLKKLGFEYQKRDNQSKGDAQNCSLEVGIFGKN